MNSRARIMFFCDWYLPGFTSGGGMRMIVNLIDRFCERYDFYVVTRNYDSKSDRTPYTEVTTSAWNKVGNASVYYLSDAEMNGRRFVQLIDEIGPSALFLNSAFSLTTILLLWARRLGKVGNIPVILAPCGSISPACLRIKFLKKRTFLLCAKIAGLFRGVIWKGSFQEEKEQILTAIGPDANVFIAADLAPRNILPGFSLDRKPRKEAGSAIFVYYSRLERVKNLLYFLERLKEVRDGLMVLKIIGPIEDPGYWEECRQAIGKLPPNISIEIEGAQKQETALEMMTGSHFFVLPTLSENFGYVFLESLAAGCPNITSDQTVWHDLESRNAGWRIALDDPERWNSTIRKCVEMSDEEYRAMSASARNYASEWLSNSERDVETENLLRLVLNSGAANPHAGTLPASA